MLKGRKKDYREIFIYDESKRRYEQKLEEKNKEIREHVEYKNKMNSENLRRRERDNVENENGSELDDIIEDFKRIGMGLGKAGKALINFFISVLQIAREHLF